MIRPVQLVGSLSYRGMRADGKKMMGLRSCDEGKSGLAFLEDDSDVDMDMESLVSASLSLRLSLSLFSPSLYLDVSASLSLRVALNPVSRIGLHTPVTCCCSPVYPSQTPRIDFGCIVIPYAPALSNEISVLEPKK